MDPLAAITLPGPQVMECWWGRHRPIPSPTAVACGKQGLGGEGCWAPHCQPPSSTGATSQLVPEKFSPDMPPPPQQPQIQRGPDQCRNLPPAEMAQKAAGQGAVGPLPPARALPAPGAPGCLLALAGSVRGRKTHPSMLIWRPSGATPGHLGCREETQGCPECGTHRTSQKGAEERGATKAGRRSFFYRIRMRG